LPEIIDRLSSLIDLPPVEVLDGTPVNVAAWYDNEMGYATRRAETRRHDGLRRSMMSHIGSVGISSRDHTEGGMF